LPRLFFKFNVFGEPEYGYQSLPELVLVPAQPFVCLGDYIGDPGGLFPWSLRLMMPGAWTKLPGNDGSSVPEEGKHGIVGAQGQEHLGLNVSSPFSSPWTCYLSGPQPQNNNSPELQVKEILL
uniref:Uncharacterized protein n=1 Tax=Rhinopithecus bieti TaxID=61621 RepID=A0A2K6MJB5_RHIBE